MLELSAPVTSPEAVRAAVSNGADAVCFGFSAFNTKRKSGSFNENEFIAAAEYCRIRGVRIYADIDTLILDNEFDAALNLLEFAASYGADAAVISDIGFLRAARQYLPDFELHAGTNMGITNLDGVLGAYAAGASRVAVAKELSRDKILYICKKSPVDIEVCCYGPLCVSYAGQCYLSGFYGKEKANRDSCPLICRESYGFGAKADLRPMCMKKLSLGSHINELEHIGVHAVRVDTSIHGPEYTALVTDIFSRAVKRRRAPGERDMRLLTEAFPSAGYTDGYYTKKTGAPMFGRLKGAPERNINILNSVKADYMDGDSQRVPVSFYGLIQRGAPVRLAARDENGNTVQVNGKPASTVGSRELTHVILQTQLYKTNGTPYYCTGVKSIVDSGLYLDTQDINLMRNELLLQLSLARRAVKPVLKGEYHKGLKHAGNEKSPGITVSVLKAEQLSAELAALKPKMLYVPIYELVKSPARITPFWENGVTAICVVLPPLIHDDETRKLYKDLSRLREIHIEDVLVSNVGHIAQAKKLGFNVRGDFSLNVYNSSSLKFYKDLGLTSCTLSFELKFQDIKEISKCMDTELIIYGRVPLMLTENCIIKSATGVCSCDKPSQIRDRQGYVFPISRVMECRNVVYSAEKLFFADRKKSYSNLGLWGARLNFTTENERECVQVMRRHLGTSEYEPAARTRGHYYGGVK